MQSVQWTQTASVSSAAAGGRWPRARLLCWDLGSRAIYCSCLLTSPVLGKALFSKPATWTVPFYSVHFSVLWGIKLQLFLRIAFWGIVTLVYFFNFVCVCVYLSMCKYICTWVQGPEDSDSPRAGVIGACELPDTWCWEHIFGSLQCLIL